MDLFFGCCGASDAATPGRRRRKPQPLATASEKPTVRSSSSATVMAEAANGTQHVVVMRHGDRMDHAQPAWFLKAERPWDPPLADHGRARAAEVGRRLRDDLGFAVHRIVVSPFLRCVETATEVVSALCDADDASENDYPVFQVSIEYGLCEVFNRSAIRTTPKKGKWGFDISELHRLQSPRIVFPTVKPVTDKLPNWEESVMDARTRYKRVIQALADKYPSENLLLVTHAEALKSAVLDYKKDVTVTEVECCAFLELQRPVSHENGSLAAGDFELVTASDQSGISYLPLSSMLDDLVK